MENSRKVKICMKTVSTQVGDKPDVIELITEGEYSPAVHEDGTEGWAVEYKDSEATGYEGSTTTVSIFGDSYASMIRRGSTETDFIIEKGRKHHCHYGTPYGSMLIGVYAHRIINRVDENGGELYFKYVIDVNSVLVSENEVYLQIIPV